MKNPLLIIGTLSIMLSPQQCFSHGTPAGGLSGEVTVGVIFIDNGSNLSPDGSRSSIANLESAPNRKLTTLPALLPEATYRFGDNNQAAWYFNTKSPLDEAGNFALSSGVEYNLPGLASFDAGVFYVPFTTAWKNPYLINVAREETDVTTWGAQFGINRILGSQLGVKFAYLQENIDDDEIALILPELARDGKIYNLTVGYDFLSASAFPIHPQLSVRKGEYDGESSSFFKVKAEVSGRYIAGRYFLMPSIYYSYKEHDEKDPVFDSTRKENGYGAHLVLRYGGLFDIKPLGLLGIAGYGRGEANENFYDTESLFCGLGLVYSF